MCLSPEKRIPRLFYWGGEALAFYRCRVGQELRPADVRASIPAEHPQFIKGCRAYSEAVRRIFVHAYYEPDRPLYGQPWAGLG
jgi:hypothetical protein